MKIIYIILIFSLLNLTYAGYNGLIKQNHGKDTNKVITTRHHAEIVRYMN